jgi:alginate O-acetyltransferase complex protein AlgI
VEQVKSGLWLWALLYAYACVHLFRFSGYTDIAIGLGKLMGLTCPRTSNALIKSNLTTFWNSWHITLAQWFRAFFQPADAGDAPGSASTRSGWWC